MLSVSASNVQFHTGNKCAVRLWNNNIACDILQAIAVAIKWDIGEHITHYGVPK